MKEVIEFQVDAEQLQQVAEKNFMWNFGFYGCLLCLFCILIKYVIQKLDREGRYQKEIEKLPANWTLLVLTGVCAILAVISLFF